MEGLGKDEGRGEGMLGVLSFRDEVNRQWVGIEGEEDDLSRYAQNDKGREWLVWSGGWSEMI